MTPIGKCTARIVIAGSAFVATFVILFECCKELILGVDFLREYGAVINVCDRIITFSGSSEDVDPTEDQRPRLRIADDDVTLPPRSCSLVPVICDNLHTGSGVAEHINALVLSQGISVARAVINVRDGHAELLLTSFSRERRQIVKGTDVAYFDEIASIQDCLSGQHAAYTVPAPVERYHPSNATASLSSSTSLTAASHLRQELARHRSPSTVLSPKTTQDPFHRILIV